MSIEYLKMIKEQEKEADEIKSYALAESKQLIKEAENEAVEIIDKARVEIEEITKVIISKAEDEAGTDYENTIHHAEWECDMIWSNAENNLDSAVGIITKKVMK